MAEALLLPLLLCLALASLLVLSRRRGRRRSPSSPQLTKLPPGPTKLPIIGNLHQLGSSPLLHRALWWLSTEHGRRLAPLPFMHLQLGFQPPTVVVSSAESAEAVLKTHDLECCNRYVTSATSALSYARSDVSFAPYGACWRELRKICVAELFTARKIASFRPIRAEEVGRMVDSIRSAAGGGGGGGGGAINLSDELVGLTSDINCRTAFGCTRRRRIHQLLRRLQPTFTQFFVGDYFPAMGWVDELMGANGQLRDVFRELDGFYQQLIDEHLRRDPMSRRSAGGGDFLDALLREQNEGYLTDDHIKGVLMNIFVAGADTSAAGVEWAMAELMRHPEMMKRAQDEVRGHVGGQRKVEEGDLHGLEYLKCVVKEALRLHPPVPLLVFRETTEHVELGEYRVPPGTIIAVNAWAIGRDPEAWERPEEFDPERWFAEHGGQEYKFIPFGEGRRICPAKNSAMVTMELVLANLLHCFDWGLLGGMKEEDISMEEAPGITVHRKSPLVLVAMQPNNI